MSLRPVVKITDDTTKAELAEYLTNLNAFAKRQPHVMEKSYLDRETDWTKAHRRMDGPLDDWLAARA